MCRPVVSFLFAIALLFFPFALNEENSVRRPHMVQLPRGIEWYHVGWHRPIVTLLCISRRLVIARVLEVLDSFACVLMSQVHLCTQYMSLLESG